MMKGLQSLAVLGLALAQNHDFTGSAEAIRSYLDATPDAKDKAVIQKQLQQIQEAAQENVQSENAPPVLRRAATAVCSHRKVSAGREGNPPSRA